MLRKILGGLALLLLLAKPSSSEIIYLEGGEQPFPIVDTEQVYVGNFPTDEIYKIKQTLISNGSSALKLNPAYTILVCDRTLGWEDGGGIENCQIRARQSLGSLDRDVSFRNNLVMIKNPASGGLETTKLDTDISNNIFLGGEYGLMIQNQSMGGDNIRDNFFGWQTTAIKCRGSANIGIVGSDGRNIFYANDTNVDVQGIITPIQAFQNWWYSKQGIFLTDEASILATCKGVVSSPSSASVRNVEYNLEVMPCQTEAPYNQSPRKTAVEGWRHYN